MNYEDIREQIESLRAHRYLSWAEALDNAAKTLELLLAVKVAADEVMADETVFEGGTTYSLMRLAEAGAAVEDA